MTLAGRILFVVNDATLHINKVAGFSAIAAVFQSIIAAACVCAAPLLSSRKNGDAFGIERVFVPFLGF